MHCIYNLIVPIRWIGIILVRQIKSRVVERIYPKTYEIITEKQTLFVDRLQRHMGA